MSKVRKYLNVYFTEVKCTETCNETQLPVKRSKDKMFVNLLVNKRFKRWSLSYNSLILCT